jgi:hypothetical protein
MKSFTFGFIPLFLVVASTATFVQAKRNGKQPGASIEVGIKCSGLDFEELDPVSTVVMKQILEESYAQAIDDKSDSSLKVFESRWSCGRGCLLTDDEVPSENSGGITLDGYWSCGRNCEQDDNTMLELVFALGGLRGTRKANGMIDMSAWEGAFVDSMVRSGRTIFRTVDQCSIQVKPSDQAEKTS